MNDVMIVYPNTSDRCVRPIATGPRCVVVSDARLKTLGPDQRRRAIKVSASILTTDPWEEACQVLPNVNTLTRNAAIQAYDQEGMVLRISTWSTPRPFCYRRTSALRQPHAVCAG